MTKEKIRHHRLYKFVDAQCVSDIIKNGSSKLTRLSKSNDPDEFMPAHRTDAWFKRIEGKEPLVLCLTPDIYNTHMWQRYGIKKSIPENIPSGGAAVIYDFTTIGEERHPVPGTDEDLTMHFLESGQFILECKYSNEEIEIPQTVDDETEFAESTPEKEAEIGRLLLSLIALKKKKWEEEKECRLIFNDEKYAALNELVTNDFRSHITGIVLGENYDSHSREELRELKENSFRKDFQIFRMVDGKLCNFETTDTDQNNKSTPSESIACLIGIFGFALGAYVVYCEFKDGMEIVENHMTLCWFISFICFTYSILVMHVEEIATAAAEAGNIKNKAVRSVLQLLLLPLSGALLSVDIIFSLAAVYFVCWLFHLVHPFITRILQ